MPNANSWLFYKRWTNTFVRRFLDSPLPSPCQLFLSLPSLFAGQKSDERGWDERGVDEGMGWWEDNRMGHCFHSWKVWLCLTVRPDWWDSVSLCVTARVLFCCLCPAATVFQVALSPCVSLCVCVCVFRKVHLSQKFGSAVLICSRWRDGEGNLYLSPSSSFHREGESTWLRAEWLNFRSHPHTHPHTHTHTHTHTLNLS